MKDTMLVFPNFKLKIVRQTDTSNQQLGAVIMKIGRHIELYILKINSSQCRQTTTKRELLGIIETLREFKNVLLGYDIEIWTERNKQYMRLRSFPLTDGG